jgi:hypothetical protein
MGTRIVLDLDPAGEPVAGTIAIDDGPARPFSGWLALGHAVDQALDAARAGPQTHHATTTTDLLPRSRATDPS